LTVRNNRLQEETIFFPWLFNQWHKWFEDMIYEDVGKWTYISCPNTSSTSMYRKLFFTQKWVLLSSGVFITCYPAIYVCSVLCRLALTHDCALHSRWNHPSLCSKAAMSELCFQLDTMYCAEYFMKKISRTKKCNSTEW
jgi:hypothetical protein